MAISKVLKKITPTSVKAFFKDAVTGDEGDDAKLKKRYEIEQARGDIYSIAGDAHQWCGLLTSQIAIIYAVLTPEQKDAIPADKRALIEASLDAYTNTITTTDIKLNEGGIDYIAGMIKKESDVAKIISE